MVCVRCKQGSVSEESAGDIHPLDSAAGDLIHSMPAFAHSNLQYLNDPVKLCGESGWFKA